MKEVTVRVYWRQDFTWEVSDDWQCTGNLGEFTEEQLEEMTPLLAEMYDYELVKETFSVNSPGSIHGESD